MLVWEMGRLHPERVSSLYNMSVPYSNAPAPPTQIFEAIFEGKFFYMLYFQPVGPAEAEFEADPRRFLRTMLYSAGGEGMANPNPLVADAPREGTRFQDILSPAPDELPAWITEADVDVYTAAFEAERLLRARSASTATWTPTGSAPRTSRRPSTPCRRASSPARSTR